MDSYEKKQLIYKFVFVAIFIACLTAVITFYATFESVEKKYSLITGEISEDANENIKTVS